MTSVDIPRFLTGIPLPNRAFTPGEKPPGPCEFPGDILANREEVAYWRGWDLLLHGFPWEAHEVWEQVWRAQSGPRKSWMQGLIRLAAALVKARSGNANAVNHHVAGALAHWRGITPDELPHGGEVLPLLEDWLNPDGRPSPQASWLVACSELKPGDPGPVFPRSGETAIPGALVNALRRAFQRETASNTVP